MSQMFHIVLIIGLSYYATQSDALPVEESRSNSILLQISSGNTNSCSNNSLFSNFSWEKVPEFGALCNIPAPSIDQATILLKYDPVPVLCMGFYETLLMLCKLAINSSLNEVFPATPDKMNNMIEKITNNDDYASVKKFCKSTVRNFTSDSNKYKNSVEARWHTIIKDELKVESKCNYICGTTESDRVHPLCSFIVWSNNVQPTLLNQETKNQEIISNDKEKNKVNGPSPPAATEQKIQASTPAQKADSATAGSDTQSSVVLPNELSGSADIGESEKEQLSKPEAVLIPEQVQPVVTADKLNQSAGISKVLPQIAVDKKTDADLTGKTDSSITKLKVEEKTKTVIVDKIPIEEPTAVQPPQKENQNAVVPQSSAVEDTVDETPVEKKPAQDGVDAEVGAGEKDINLQETEDEDSDDANMAAESTKLKEPVNTNSDFVEEVVLEDHFIEVEDTHFFSYFLFMAILTILAYLAFHNKKKLLALAVEGRRTRGTRRRPNTSNYSKLDCSLEEAMSSKSTASVTHVLY